MVLRKYRSGLSTGPSRNRTIKLPNLGGSIFTHNAVEFDYCIAESIASLCAICDDVVVLDCQSTDDTVGVLKECVKKHNNLRIFEGGNWECAPDKDRLAILATEAKNFLKTEWHFMLQADEVIHERSFDTIRIAIRSPKYESFMVRRLNLFGDLNHFLPFDLAHEKKPCSDHIIRLAKLKFPAVGDAESLGVDAPTLASHHAPNINVFHYGMVRRDKNFIEKIINMQGWFFGPGGQPDHRVVAMKNRGDGIFVWQEMKNREDLKPIPMSHPIFAKEWAEERQKEKTPIV